MLMDQLRAWFLGQPVTPEKPMKPREQRDAQRAAAACGPKPVAEAVGDALAAVGELVSAIRESAKQNRKATHKGKGKKRSRARAKSASSRSASSRSGATARRGVVVVEARVEPRATASRKPAARSRRSARMTIDTPIIVAPERAPATPERDGGDLT
jgi:hypothetical protein